MNSIKTKSSDYTIIKGKAIALVAKNIVDSTKLALDAAKLMERAGMDISINNNFKLLK